jgi:hypothetical protein
MPDHLHGIIAFPREPGMKATMTRWKHFLASHQKIEWQRDFFDHRLRDHHELEEKASYILLNPVRWGLSERAEDWPWVYRPKDRRRLSSRRVAPRAARQIFERLSAFAGSRCPAYARAARAERRAL